MAMATVISFTSRGDYIGKRQSRACEICEDIAMIEPRHLRKPRSGSASKGADIRLTRRAPTLKETFFWLERVRSIAGRPEQTNWTLVELEYASFKLEDTILLEHLRPMLVC